MRIWSNPGGNIIMNNVDKMEYDTECDRLEAEIRGLVNCLKLAVDPCKTSLQEAINTTISEGKEFKKWQETRQPLDNIWLFQRTGDEFTAIGQFHSLRFSLFKSFRTIFRLVFSEGSQFEIWACERKNEPVVPLFKALLSTFKEGSVSVIEESLRSDLSLKIVAQRETNLISFDLMFSNLSWENEMNTSSAAQSNKGIGGVDMIPSPVLTFKTPNAALWSRVTDIWSDWKEAIRQDLMKSAVLKYAVLFSILLVLVTTTLFSEQVPLTVNAGGDAPQAEVGIIPEESYDILRNSCYKKLCNDPQYLTSYSYYY
jgi:hypothetical protein